MSELTEFLLARIAEDEEAAKSARFLQPSGPDPEYRSLLDGLLRMQQRFSPARVLAECEAKRRIVELCTWVNTFARPAVREVRSDDSDSFAEVLCALALPYADHPDYDEQWRP